MSNVSTAFCVVQLSTQSIFYFLTPVDNGCKVQEEKSYCIAGVVV
jgi:hypothetical protein